MTRSSRRTLLKSAAAGAAALGLVGAGRGLTGSRSGSSGPIGTSSDPVVAVISDARKGEVVVMVGTREIIRRDTALVARLLAIAKEAGDVVPS